MIIDARSVPVDRPVQADLCVIGAGPAGIAIARRLEGAGLGVVIVESGETLPTVRAQHLNEGDVVGRPYWPLHSSRFRGVGGSANRWGGWCRPFDEIDFEARPWVDRSGWPITYDEMARYHPDTNAFLGLQADAFGDTDGGWPTPDGLTESGLGTVAYHFSPYQRSLGVGYQAQLEASTDTRLYTAATVTDLRLAPGTSRLEEVVVSRPQGGAFRVRARDFVLAAGGIENARVLLAARRDRPAGLGNEHDAVGRHFMEHVHVPVGYALTTDPVLSGPFFEATGVRVVGQACGALGGTVATQRAEELLPLSITVTAPPHDFGNHSMGTSAALDVLAQRARHRIAPHQPRFAPSGDEPPAQRSLVRAAVSEARARARHWRFEQRRRSLLAVAESAGIRDASVRALYVRGEQVPNTGSRVLLGERTDAFGVPVAQLDWQLSEQDVSSVRTWMGHLDTWLHESGSGRLALEPEWESLIEGGPHHMGTTRMSSDPSQGVVDADCRVHSVENLYVAGSSVFSTGGYANPTYPLVALALRLADHLRARAGTPLVVSPTEETSTEGGS